MADTNVNILVKAKDEASKVLGDVGKSSEGIRDNIKSVSVAAGAAGAAMVAGLGVAANAAADFESQMSNVNTLLGDNEAHFQTLKEGVKDFASTSVKPMEELTSSMYDIVSAGIDMDSQLTTLADSEKLAVAGLGSVGEATDLVTSSMNAFGVTSEQAANTVFEAVQGGKTTVAELAQGFGAVAGTAKELGVQYEEFLAITSAGTTVGKQASQVWTEQKAVMTALVKPTTEMSNLFKKIGVESGQQLIETSGGLVGALQKLKEASAGNNETFAKALSSSEGLALANQILGSSYEDFQGILGNMSDGLNSVDQAYEKQKSTTTALWQQLKNQFNVALIDLGTAILPTLTAAMTGLTDGLQWLKAQWDALSPTQQGIITDVLMVVAAITSLVAIIGGAVLAVGTISTAITAFGTVLAVAGAAIGAISLPILAIIGVLGLLAAGVYLVISNWELLKASAALIWDSIVLKVTEAALWIEGVWKKMWGASEEEMAAFNESADARLQELQGIVDADLEEINNIHQEKFDTQRQQAEDSLAQQRDAIEALTGEAKEAAIAQWTQQVDAAKEKYGEMNIGTTAEVQDMRAKQEAEIAAMKDGTVAEMGAMSGEVTGKAAAMKDDVSVQMGAMNSDMVAQMVNMKSGVVNEAANMNSQAVAEVAAMKDNANAQIQGAASGAASAASSWGASLVNNLAAGIKGAMGGLLSAVAAVSSALSKVHQSYNPLLPAERWGQHFVQNLATGIAKGKPILRAKMDDLAGTFAMAGSPQGDTMAGMRAPMSIMQANNGGGVPSVTLNFGNVTIAKEVDAEKFIKNVETTLVRSLELKQIGSQ